MGGPSLDLSAFEVLAVFVVGYIFGRVHAAVRDPRRAEERRKQQASAERGTEERYSALSPDLRQKLELLVGDGRIIEAVKELRLLTGCGLKEAKDVIDLIAARSSRGARVS